MKTQIKPTESSNKSLICSYRRSAMQRLRAFNVRSILAGIALIFSPVAIAGQFEPPVNYFLNRSPNGIARGDFNRDGNTDLVATACGDANCSTTGSVFVFLGRGNGDFTRGSKFVAGPSGTDA